MTLGYRNEWKGHDAIHGDAEAARRLQLLENELARVQKPLSGAFNGWKLIKPGAMRKRGDIFEHEVHLLLGRDMIFRTEKLDSPVPMDSNELYFLDGRQEFPVPVELLPLIRIKASPETQANTCYFYNKLEDSGEVRLVSYHFEHEADIRTSDPEINAAIADLTRRT